MTLAADTAARIEATLGRKPLSARPLPGGCIAEVLRVELSDGGTVVAKLAPKGGLAIEAYMLDYLARHSSLPVPAVLRDDDDLLLLEFLDGGDRIDAAAQEDAAHHVAALHAVTGENFGLERDTLIGPLHQPNPPTARWVDFLREQRLLYMGRTALDSGHLPRKVFAQLEAFCGKLERYVEEPAAPALIHGDMWGGNVLARNGRIAGFIDPAIYYADPEIELAFTTLFATFGEPFFKRYAELIGLRDGFFEVRRDIYNLYPLLVHTALFGGGYAGSVARILERLA
ncbi:fructosamine kinase family protein [Ferruginivarius sediminum]|uniref:Fructosamine kinase n=1 Tax=Ferruginivarius sediminum TaxID=2661937 RepID=A0A369TDL3_9PROT|nr:fructosamine kinase family protein [Ferruginivarius sediminum]RDD63413.1 fructosamine kinase [Ferruginivarius sediminum]